jgi:hypothetical protein
MPALTVYLIDEVGLSTTVKDAIRTRVTDLLGGTISRAGALHVSCGIDSASASWVSGCPSMQSQDVVIYLRNSPPDGDGFRCNSTPDGGWIFGTHGLTTWDGSGTLSVVWVPPCTGGATPQGDILGSVAFHELMHNKLHLDNRALHGQGGLAAAAVGGNTPLTDANVRLLAPALSRAQSQVCP